MAKFTELLAEYVEGGGELPSAFDEIDGFEDIFIAHFCDREIGFETEELFAIKLEKKAKIVIPEYKARLTALSAALDNLYDPQKVRHTDVDAGEQNSKTWALPFNDDDADPNAKAHSDAFHNEDEVTESGFTPDEAIRNVEKLEGKVKIVMNALLDEFEPVFMQIF